MYGGRRKNMQSIMICEANYACTVRQRLEKLYLLIGMEWIEWKANLSLYIKKVPIHGSPRAS